MTSKPISFHRHLVREAWRLVWQRRPLWVLGLFGGFVLSGATIEPAFAGLARVARLGTFWLQARTDGWAEAAAPFGRAIAEAGRLSPLAATFGVSACAVVAALFVVFAFLCQGGLIAGLAERKPMVVPAAVARGWSHAWTVFVVGLLGCVYQLVLLLLVSLPILFYVEGRGADATFAACLAILLYLPLAVGGRAVVVFASIHAVRRKTTAPEAIRVGVLLFFSRWLETFETSLLLLAISACAAAAFVLLLLVAAIPLLILFAAVNAGGWLNGAAIVTTVGVLVFCVALLVFAGLLSAFRIAVWLRFYERVLHPVHGPRIVAKLKRLFHPAHVR